MKFWLSLYRLHKLNHIKSIAKSLYFNNRQLDNLLCSLNHEGNSLLLLKFYMIGSSLSLSCMSHNMLNIEGMSLNRYHIPHLDKFHCTLLYHNEEHFLMCMSSMMLLSLSKFHREPCRLGRKAGLSHRMLL